MLTRDEKSGTSRGPLKRRIVGLRRTTRKATESSCLVRTPESFHRHMAHLDDLYASSQAFHEAPIKSGLSQACWIKYVVVAHICSLLSTVLGKWRSASSIRATTSRFLCELLVFAEAARNIQVAMPVHMNFTWPPRTPRRKRNPTQG